MRGADRPPRACGSGSFVEPFPQGRGLVLQADFSRPAVLLALARDRSEGLAELAPFGLVHHIGGQKVGGHIGVARSGIAGKILVKVKPLADGRAGALNLNIQHIRRDARGRVVGALALARQRVAENLFRVLTVVSVLARKRGKVKPFHLRSPPLCSRSISSSALSSRTSSAYPWTRPPFALSRAYPFSLSYPFIFSPLRARCPGRSCFLRLYYTPCRAVCQ